MSELKDLSDVLDLVAISHEQANTLGMSFEEFVFECTFDRRDCTNTSMFIQTYSARYGRCFTFSSDVCECSRP